MEKSSFFNAQMDASGEYDREYLAEDFASYFSKFISNGVFPNPSTGLQVIAADTPNMTVTLSVGYGYINGYKYENTAPLTFSIGVADGVLNRKDAIFIRYSKLGRAIKAYKIAGTPGASAVAPSVVRTEDYYDLCVAIISVNAGITVIPQSLIEDTRLNTSLCGIVTGLVEQVDTTTLYNQIQSDLSQFKTVSQAEFDAWFDDLKGKLGEDPATALQLQVDNLNAAAVGDSFKLKGAPVSIAYAGANRIASITAYGETPQGGTVEAPVALTGVDSVQVCGRNLLPNKAITKTVAGITYTANPDKSVTAKGTASSWGNIVIDADFSLPAGTYTLNSNMQAAGVNLVIGKDTSGTKYIAVSATTSKTFELSAPIKHCVAYIAVAPDSVVDTTIYPMLNLGTSALPYETYQGSVTQLNIPRPLHEVGDVRDVCRTRVKSVYDKRIVLDGAEDWKMGSAVGDGAPYIFCDLLNDHYQAFLIISSRFPSTNILASNKNQGIGCWDRSLYLRYDSLFTNVEELKTYLSAHPLTVYYQSTAYDGTNGLDVCLMKYQTGFVELDGTEDVVFDTYGNTQKRIRFDLDRNAIARYALKFSHGNPGDTPTVTGGISASFNRDVLNRLQIIGIADTWTALGVTDTATAKTWLAAQKEAGTPVQIAYQLATPETYATDPVDFDNTAGPLTVMTGGEVVVRMTELVGSRSPELAGKMDKATYDADGDGVVDRAAVADKVAKKLILQNNAGQQMAEFDGSEEKTVKLTPAQVGAEPTFTKNNAFNKNFGSAAGTVCQGNDGRLSNARRASNITMGYDGNLWINYS